MLAPSYDFFFKSMEKGSYTSILLSFLITKKGSSLVSLLREMATRSALCEVDWSAIFDLQSFGRLRELQVATLGACRSCKPCHTGRGEF